MLIPFYDAVAYFYDFCDWFSPGMRHTFLGHRAVLDHMRIHALSLNRFSFVVLGLVIQTAPPFALSLFSLAIARS
jgi:hypothetical protein